MTTSRAGESASKKIRHLLSAGRGGHTGLQCGDARGDFLVNPL